MNFITKISLTSSWFRTQLIISYTKFATPTTLLMHYSQFTLATCARLHNLQACPAVLWPVTYHSICSNSSMLLMCLLVTRLRSFTSDDLIVPDVRLTSIGSRTFPVARAHIWNTLPLSITSASSLTVFKQFHKHHLFSFSFTSDFHSFIVVEHIGFFHGALQFFDWQIDGTVIRFLQYRLDGTV